MAIGWYLVVSALIFCIGAGGVLARRNPLVILLCLELMLNGANLALVAFARMWGGEDGQMFALIVMVVAAAEVTVGLGLIVAHLPPPAARSTSTSSRAARLDEPSRRFAWLVLLCPLVGHGRDRARPPLAARAAPPAGSGRSRSRCRSRSRRALIALLSHGASHRELTSTLWNYDFSVGVDAKLQILVDPLSVFMILVVSGVSTLIHLYSVSYMAEDRGLPALLRLPELLRASRCCCWCWPATSCC